jgi:hypothetical protein
MKIPDPRPGTTGSTLNCTTARWRYECGCSHIPSLAVENGGRAPQRTWTNRLYVGDDGSSSHQSPQTSRR